MKQSVLLVEGLKKEYSEDISVGSISFSVSANEIVGLLGPNGAGKTTIINMILGVLSPTSGSILIQGRDIVNERSKALSLTNFSAVYAPLPGNLSVYQNLHVFAMLYGVDEPHKRIAELLDSFDLKKFRNTKCGVLSSGEQTRVSLAKAMLNRPDLLLLDEPTASLDPCIALDIRSVIIDFARTKQCAVLWTSHNMYEVEAVCDRVLFLSRGKILLEGNPKTLPKEQGKRNLEELFIAVAREPLALGGV